MSRLSRWLPSCFSILLSLLVSYLALAIVRSDFSIANQAFAQMFWGGLGGVRELGESAGKAALLILTGLSVAVALSVGFFNIGAQGQMMVGAIATTALAALVELPRLIHPTLCIATGFIAGMLYGLLPAWLKVHRRVHEVVSTIMLNWVAASLIENWLVVGPLRPISAGESIGFGTRSILPSAELPRIFGENSRFNAGLFLAIGAALMIWVWQSRTMHGFETRALGLGWRAAEVAGIPVRQRMLQAVGLSGGLAGTAGAILILGIEHNYPLTFTSPYGFDGISVALVGQNHPIAVLAVASFFGVLRAGGTRIQLLGIHKSFPELIQGLALVLVAAKLAWEAVLPRGQRSAPGVESRSA